MTVPICVSVQVCVCVPRCASAHIGVFPGVPMSSCLCYILPRCAPGLLYMNPCVNPPRCACVRVCIGMDLCVCVSPDVSDLGCSCAQMCFSPWLRVLDTAPPPPQMCPGADLYAPVCASDQMCTCPAVCDIQIHTHPGPRTRRGRGPELNTPRATPTVPAPPVTPQVTWVLGPPPSPAPPGVLPEVPVWGGGCAPPSGRTRVSV